MVDANIPDKSMLALERWSMMIGVFNYWDFLQVAAKEDVDWAHSLNKIGHSTIFFSSYSMISLR